MSKWREVYAQEAITWALGKTIAGMTAGQYDSEVLTNFTDGSAMRVTWERGRAYSEYTEDPDEVHIEVRDPV